MPLVPNVIRKLQSMALSWRGCLLVPGVAGELPFPLTFPVICCSNSQPSCTPHTTCQVCFELSSLLQVHELNGIKIVTYCSPLYFANSEIFREKIIAKVSNALRNFCLQSIPNGPCSLLYCYVGTIKPRMITKDGYIHPLLFHIFLPDLQDCL